MLISAPRNTSPSNIFTPEKAILEIQDILEFALHERHLYSHSELKTVLEVFKRNFPIKEGKLAFLEGEKNSFNFDELKQHVLEILVPKFLADEKSADMLLGTRVSEKLSQAANNWPTQKRYVLIKRHWQNKLKKENKLFVPLASAKTANQLIFSEIIQVEENSKSTDDAKLSTVDIRRHRHTI